MFKTSAAINSSLNTVDEPHHGHSFLNSTSVDHFSKLSRHRKNQRMIDEVRDPNRRLKVQLQTIRREITDNVHQFQRPRESAVTLGLLHLASPSPTKTDWRKTSPSHRGSSGRKSKTITIAEEREDSKQQHQRAVPVSKLQLVEKKFDKMEETFGDLEMGRRWNKVDIQKKSLRMKGSVFQQNKLKRMKGNDYVPRS